MNESLSYVLEVLLKKNKIIINEKELEFQLESHPSYPSLHSLTGALSHFRIDNLALRVPVNEETLIGLPASFIAQFKSSKGEHFVLAEKVDNGIEITYDKKVKIIYTIESFLNEWTGILLAVEKSENIIKEKTSSYGRLLYYLAVAGLLALFFSNSPNLFQSIHFLLSLTGIVISIFIVQHELGIQSKALDKFCSRSNEKIGCDSVLSSKGATLFKNIKLSDIGLVYFAGLALSWIFLILTKTENHNSIIILSISAVPFTFFSIYYQSRVVKKWCPLCLTILAVLWCQALSLMLLNIREPYFLIDIYSNLIIAFSFITITATWFFLYPKLKLVQEHRELKIGYLRFKNNYDIFEFLISRNPKIDTTISESSEIILGNKSEDVPLKIILITNPLCGHCKDAHKAVMQVLAKNKQDVQIKIRFNVNTKDKNNTGIKAAMHLLHIYHQGDEERTIQALHEVYSDTGLNKWVKKQKINKKAKYFEELGRESKWCRMNNINFTPEILINSRPFPNEYDRNDIQNFIEDMIENEQQSEENLIPEIEYTT